MHSKTLAHMALFGAKDFSITPLNRKTFIYLLSLTPNVEFIQLKEVGKTFGKSKVLSDVNLTIEEGDIFGIIGQSGSGKTTLLNLIAGFIEPTDGEVVYFSKVDHTPKNLHKHFYKIKKHIGYTPQHTSFYPKLSIAENLIHFGKIYGMDKNTLKANAESLLQFTGLHTHRHKLGEELSGGMQKRLDISCSLIHRPKLLILDEPTADLDPITQEEIIDLIKAVNGQGVTVVIASHHLESLERICTKLAIVHNGLVKSQGEIEAVLQPYHKENISINIRVGRDKDRIIALLRKLPVTKIIDQGHQLVVQPANPELAMVALLRMIKQENLYLHDLDLRKPSLKEVLTIIAQEGIPK